MLLFIPLGRSEHEGTVQALGVLGKSDLMDSLQGVLDVHLIPLPHFPTKGKSNPKRRTHGKEGNSNKGVIDTSWEKRGK